MYHNGKGVPQDYAQAHMWLDLAASSFLPGEDIHLDTNELWDKLDRRFRADRRSGAERRQQPDRRST